MGLHFYNEWKEERRFKMLEINLLFGLLKIKITFALPRK